MERSHAFQALVEAIALHGGHRATVHAPLRSGTIGFNLRADGRGALIYAQALLFYSRISCCQLGPALWV